GGVAGRATAVRCTGARSGSLALGRGLLQLTGGDVAHGLLDAGQAGPDELVRAEHVVELVVVHVPAGAVVVDLLARLQVGQCRLVVVDDRSRRGGHKRDVLGVGRADGGP